MRRSATVTISSLLLLLCGMGVVGYAAAAPGGVVGRQEARILAQDDDSQSVDQDDDSQAPDEDDGDAAETPAPDATSPETPAVAEAPADADDNGAGGVDREELFLSTADVPVPPAFLRLLRIILEPGAISVNHTHPGPEFGRVESGELTVNVRGEATVRRADEDDGEDAPEDEDITLGPGDQITYPTGTEMELRNEGDETLVILSAVYLPAGSQRPPTIAYPDGTPEADAFEGVSFVTLGDAVATNLPEDTAVVAIDQLTLGDGAPIPGFAGPVLLSLQSGGLDVTIEAGDAQVYRSSTTELDTGVEPGSDIALAPGDALFFPTGLTEAARVEGSGELVLVRLGTSDEGQEGDATPAADSVIAPEGAAVIAVNTPEGGFPTPTPPPAETPAATAGGFDEGATVVVNTDSVNLRSEPSTESDVVAVLALGEELVITGPPEEGGDFQWYPVQVAANAELSGFIAAQFVDASE